jgi:large subunit ribosomal protein L41
MRPSLALFSKASRLPLNSKKANKDFYKGTRTGNIMVRRRMPVANRNTGEQLFNNLGQPRTWNIKTNRIDEARVPSYIVPPGIAQCEVGETFS